MHAAAGGRVLTARHTESAAQSPAMANLHTTINKITDDLVGLFGDYVDPRPDKHRSNPGTRRTKPQDTSQDLVAGLLDTYWKLRREFRDDR